MYQVLIVDDDKNYRYAVRESLEWEKLGFHISDEAINGNQALRKMQEKKFDLVITDMDMPSMNGVELIKEAKKKSLNAIFLSLSAYDDFEFVKSSLLEGAIDYILKFELEGKQFEEVINRIKKMLDERMKEVSKKNILENANIQRTEIKKALIYMEDYYPANLTLEEIASYVGLNKNYFSNIFKEETGETFVKYLNKLRIQKAIKLMEQGIFRNYELAEMVGFGSSNYFSKIFKELNGITIEEYKKKHIL